MAELCLVTLSVVAAAVALSKADSPMATLADRAWPDPSPDTNRRDIPPSHIFESFRPIVVEIWLPTALPLVDVGPRVS
jgi:hypothetical protein